jgi:hypothetical protein
MARKRKQADTTVKAITVPFEDALAALLRTPPPPKNLGRPKAKKKKKKTQGKRSGGLMDDKLPWEVSAGLQRVEVDGVVVEIRVTDGAVVYSVDGVERDRAVIEGGDSTSLAMRAYRNRVEAQHENGTWPPT